MVCGKLYRHQHLYLSESHQVFVMMERSISPANYFLIHYKLVGCADMSIPSNHNFWFKRLSLEKALIGCKLTNEKWKVACDLDGGGEWIGEYSNCTEVVVARSSVKESFQNTNYTNKPAMIVASVLMGIVILVIFILSIMCYKRNKYSQGRQHHHQCRPQSSKSKTYYSDDDFFDPHHHHSSHHHPHPSHQNQQPQLTTYNTHSLRYGSYHGNVSSKRSLSPTSRCAYSEYSATANYEKMDENYVDEDHQSDNQSPPPLPKKMKSAVIKATAVSISEDGEKITHIWQMPLPVPGE